MTRKQQSDLIVLLSELSDLTQKLWDMRLNDKLAFTLWGSIARIKGIIGNMLQDEVQE